MLTSYVVLVCALTVVLVTGQQVSTPQGVVKGSYKRTLKGRTIEAYLGVPYAKPPVGPLRFRDPEPYGRWIGVRDATEDAPVCLQPGMILGLATNIGTEDCLFLNVYTPSTSNKLSSYPVMVFIHGGAFYGGTGADLYYGSKGLLDKDVILVTINYRLGAFGFASMEDSEMPGNYGLKDQVLALRWVQDNIRAYGGNPDSVTIFGQSAGGASVHYLTISPLAKGLFHRAIFMGGTAHGPWAIRLSGVMAERTKKLASILGCKVDTSKNIVECLRNIPAKEFPDTYKKFAVWDEDPVVTFSPVVESASVPGAFLTDYPINCKISVPLMTGITKDEGLWRMIIIALNDNFDEILEDMDKNFIEIASHTLFIQDIAENPTEISKKVKKFYFGDKKISREIVQNITNMYTDGWFLHPLISTVQSNKGPTYMYYFQYSGTRSLTDILPAKNRLHGVSHGDELQYIFPSKNYFGLVHELTSDSNDLLMVDEMVGYWTNFAIHGNPTPKGSKLTWEPVSDMETMNYLSIDLGKTEMKKNLLPDRYNFWNNLQWRSKIITNRIKVEL